MGKRLYKHARKTTRKVALPVTQPVIAAVCDDAEKLTFAKFLKCQSGDLSALVISGTPSQQQLFFAWISILSSYYSIIGSKESLRYVKLVGKMEALNIKIATVKALCQALRNWYNPGLIKCLQGWGYRLTFSENTLLADLAMVETDLGNANFQLEKLRLEYNAMEALKEKENRSAGKSTKESYMRILYAIEKHRGQRYRPDDITVYEFGMWYNELIEYSQVINKAYGKH